MIILLFLMLILFILNSLVRLFFSFRFLIIICFAILSLFCNVLVLISIPGLSFYFTLFCWCFLNSLKLIDVLILMLHNLYFYYVMSICILTMSNVIPRLLSAFIYMLVCLPML